MKAEPAGQEGGSWGPRERERTGPQGEPSLHEPSTCREGPIATQAPTPVFGTGW